MSVEPIRQYTTEIHDALGYWATWLPGNPLELGQCGPIRHRVFDPQDSLANFKIEFETEKGGEPSNIQYVSEGGVSYTVQAAADNQRIPEIPQGKAGIKLRFSRDNAIVFVATQARHHRIAGTNRLAKTIYDRISVGEFPPQYAVVTEVVVADSGTIVISSGSGAELAMSAEADLTAGLLDLASGGLGFSRVSSQDLRTEIIAKESLTPLFKLVGLKRNGRFIWSKEDVSRLGFEDIDRDSLDFGELEFAHVDP